MKKFFWLWVFFSSSFLFAESYDGQAAADYAKRYTTNYDKDYKSDLPSEMQGGRCSSGGETVCPEYWNKDYAMYLYKNTSRSYNGILPEGALIGTGDDCTNFISQAMKAGGIKYDLTEADNSYYENDEDFWFSFNAKNKPYVDVSDVGDSTSWIRVNELRQRFIDGYVKAIRIVDIKQTKIGDIAFLYHDGKYGHLVIITKVENTKRYYSAHERDRLDYDFAKIPDIPEFWRPVGSPSFKSLILNKTSESYLSSKDVYSSNRNKCYTEMFSFHLSKKQKVKIELKSKTGKLDTYLFLINSKMETIEHDDDGGDGRNSTIEKVLTSGTYYLDVTTYSKLNYGPISVKVSTEDSGESSLKRIFLNSSESSTLTSSSDLSNHRDDRYAKQYYFTLNKKTKVKIKLDMSDSMDAYLYLSNYGSSQYYIEKDDDGGKKHGMGKRDSYISETLNEGDYIIEVTTYGKKKTGNFTLYFEDWFFSRTKIFILVLFFFII